MKFIKLQAGSFVEGEDKQQGDNMLDKKAMLVYTGDFESMDGPVSITDEHIDLIAKTHNSFLSKVKRLATGDLPARYCPPIQLDHSTSAAMTVGRLVGDLVVGTYNEGDGDKKALYGTVRFLGRENVEKAQDGRYTHLSIGADLETGKLNELSVTPFPAAPNAALLSKPVAEVTSDDQALSNAAQNPETGHTETHPVAHTSRFAVGDAIVTKHDKMGGLIPAGSKSIVQHVGDGTIMVKKHVRVKGGQIPQGYVYHEDEIEHLKG